MTVTAVALLGGGPVVSAVAETPASSARPAPRALGAEIPSMRTTYSSTFHGPAGTLVGRFSSVPVNFRGDDGSFHPIDTDLHETADGGVANEAGPATVQLPETLQDAVRVGDDDRWASFELIDGDGSRVQTQDDTARYTDVLDGVDATYDALPSGVKETLLVSDHQAPSAYSFRLRSSAGLSAVQRPSGAVELRDASGVARFTLPAPTVQAAGDPGPTTDHVAFELSSDGQQLTVRVDPTWLANAALPVEIDPTAYVGQAQACTLNSGATSTSSCNGLNLEVGRQSTANKRTAVRFPGLRDYMAPDTNVTIEDAELSATLRSKTSTAADMKLKVTGLAHTLATGATWNTYDGTHAWTTAGGDRPPTNDSDYVTETNSAISPQFVGGTVSVDVSALVERWIRDDNTNHGLLIAQANESVNDRIVLAGPAENSGKTPPTLSITYNTGRGYEPDNKTYVDTTIDSTSSAHLNPANGSLAVTARDLELPSATGLGLSIGRTYNSRQNNFGQGFGNAWTPTINGANTTMAYTWFDGARVVNANGGATYRMDRDPANDTASTLAFKRAPGLAATVTAVNSADGAGAGRTTVAFDSGITWSYDAPDGYKQRLVRIQNAAGAHIDINYLPNTYWPNISTIVDANNQTTTFGYDTHSLLHTITGPSAGQQWIYNLGYHTTPYEYASLDSVTSPAGATTTYGYASIDVLHTVLASGQTTTVDYGDDARVGVLHPSASTQTRSFAYDPGTTIGPVCPVAHPALLRTEESFAGSDDRAVFCSDDTATVRASYNVDRTAPSVPTPSGPLRDLAGLYTNSTGSTPVTVAAADFVPFAGASGAGVQRLEVKEGSTVLTAVSLPCAASCPANVSNTISVNVGSLGEGPHNLTIVAFDAAGHSSTSAPWTIGVDRTAPSAASDVVSDTYDPASGILGVMWQVNGDPAPNTSPTIATSGISKSIVVAHLPSGDQTFVGTDGDVSIASAGTATFSVDVTEIDAAGNASPGITAVVGAGQAPTMGPDVSAPTQTLQSVSAIHTAQDNKTVIQWEDAVDGAGANGAPPSGIAAYHVQYRIGSGAWVTTNTDTPSITLAGGSNGDPVQVKVQPEDVAGNQGAVVTSAVTNVTAADGAFLDSSCLPGDDGIPPDCNDDGSDVEDGGTEVTLTPLASRSQARSTNLPRYRINISVGWSTARIRPNSFVIGGIHDGWTLDGVANVDTGSITARGNDFGKIEGNYNGCGWVLSAFDGSAFANNGSSDCNNYGPDAPRMGVIALGVNPKRKDGTATQLRGDQRDGVRFCTNITPAVDLISFTPQRHTCAGRSKVIKYAQLSSGDYTVYWRYVLKGGWVMVKEASTHRANDGNIKWWWVRRSAFGVLCPRASAASNPCSPAAR